jgi:PAS domain S-box-containing protein
METVSGRYRSLQGRILALFSIMAMVLVILGLTMSTFHVRIFKEDFSKRNLSFISSVAEQVESYLEYHIEDFEHLSHDISGLEIGQPSFGKSLKRKLEHLPLVAQIFFLDQNGAIVQVTPDNPGLIGFNAYSRPFFKELIADIGSMELSNSHISATTGGRTVTLITKLEKGYLAANLDLTKLNNIIQSEYTASGGFVAIVDRDGTVIAHSERKADSITEKFLVLESVQQGLSGSKGTYEETVGSVKGFLSIHPVRQTGWAVLLFQPRKTIFAAVDKPQELTLTVLFGALFASLFISLTVMRKIMNPVQRMIDQTRRVSNGEYNVSVQPKYKEFKDLTNGFNSMARSIEAREDDLRRSEARYRELFMNNPLPIMIFRIGDMTILDVNDAAVDDYGFDRDEFIGMSVLQIRPAEDRDAVKSGIRAMNNDREKFGIWRHMKKDGSVFYVDITAHNILYEGVKARMAICKDVTTQVEVEEALRDNQEHLRATLESIGDAIVIIDTDMKVTWSNRQAVNIFDLKEGDLCHQIFHRCNTTCDGCSMLRSFDEEKVIQKEEELFSAEGEKRTYLISTAPMYDSWGNVTKVVKSFKDIEILKESERLAHKSLAEKEALLKEVHHRVKNNLQAVSGLLNMQSSFTTDLWTRKILKDSQNRILSMSLIHEKLYQMEDVDRIDFSDYVKILVRRIGSVYGMEKRDIQINVRCDDIYFNVDTALPVGLIVTELMSNSFKHAFPESTMGQINLSLQQNGGEAFTLIHEDDGIGMPEEFKLENSMSLGISLVRSYVAGLGGEMGLEKGGGTRYTITFSEYEECHVEDL